MNEIQLSKVESQLQGHDSTVRPDDQRVESQEPRQSDTRPLLETHAEQSHVTSQVAGLNGKFFDQQVGSESIFEDNTQFLLEQNQLEQLLEELRVPGQLKGKQEAAQKNKERVDEKEYAEISEQLNELNSAKKEVEELEKELIRKVEELLQKRDVSEMEQSESKQRQSLLRQIPTQEENNRRAIAEGAPDSRSEDSSKEDEGLSGEQSLGPSEPSQESIQVNELRTELAKIFGISISKLRQRNDECESFIEVENEPLLEVEHESQVDEVSVVVSSLKKLSLQELEAMRSNLDSFRELANLSARSAVAKSNQLREQVILQALSAITGLGWLITLALFSVDLWSTSNYRSLATVVGSCTLIFTAKMLFTYLSIRQLDVQRGVRSKSMDPELPQSPDVL